MVDYRKLRFNNIFSNDFRHLIWLIFWPLYLFSFFALEAFCAPKYFPIHSSLDDMIPFCEYFIVPYVFWYLFLFLIHIYTLLVDVDSFKKLMFFLSVSFGVSTLIFAFFPSCQQLRPEEFARDNVFVDFVKGLYSVDTNTNVFPSLHVVGSFAVLFTAWNAKGLNTPIFRTINLTITVVITASTVFLKQHSMWDIVSGVILSAVLYPFCFILPDKIKKKKGNKRLTA